MTGGNDFCREDGVTISVSISRLWDDYVSQQATPDLDLDPLTPPMVTLGFSSVPVNTAMLALGEGWWAELDAATLTAKPVHMSIDPLKVYGSDHPNWLHRWEAKRVGLLANIAAPLFKSIVKGLVSLSGFRIIGEIGPQKQSEMIPHWMLAGRQWTVSRDDRVVISNDLPLGEVTYSRVRLSELSSSKRGPPTGSTPAYRACDWLNGYATSVLVAGGKTPKRDDEAMTEACKLATGCTVDDVRAAYHALPVKLRNPTPQERSGSRRKPKQEV